MSYTLGELPAGLQAEIDRIAADPASTRSDARKRPDAFVTPGLEIARALMRPRLARSIDAKAVALAVVIGALVIGATTRGRG